MPETGEPRSGWDRELVSLSASVLSEFLAHCDNVYWLEARSEGTTVACNPAFQKRFGSEWMDQPVWNFLTEPAAAELRGILEGEPGPLPISSRLHFLDSQQSPFALECRLEVRATGFVLIGEPPHGDYIELQDELMSLNSRLTEQLRENQRQAKVLRQTKAKLLQTIEDLVSTQRHLTNLQAVIPICMVCGKVKTGESKWEDVLTYFQRNNLSLSHGYCPKCVDLEMEKLNS